VDVHPRLPDSPVLVQCPSTACLSAVLPGNTCANAEGLATATDYWLVQNCRSQLTTRAYNALFCEAHSAQCCTLV